MHSFWNPAECAPELWPGLLPAAVIGMVPVRTGNSTWLRGWTYGWSKQVASVLIFQLRRDTRVWLNSGVQARRLKTVPKQFSSLARSAWWSVVSASHVPRCNSGPLWEFAWLMYVVLAFYMKRAMYPRVIKISLTSFCSHHWDTAKSRKVQAYQEPQNSTAKWFAPVCLALPGDSMARTFSGQSHVTWDLRPSILEFIAAAPESSPSRMSLQAARSNQGKFLHFLF